ncbi:hypothetical protein FOZ62_001739 [Perkinsus olseni]|uniref:Uncharacterized protein n=1 Tax=Perkinsus olseni TaxID=32597 RepID=A0A7J6PUN4_PEROL|nr:hypothetical protein FOZ62_001739 [Perkinsus olseni]
MTTFQKGAHPLWLTSLNLRKPRRRASVYLHTTSSGDTVGSVALTSITLCKLTFNSLRQVSVFHHRLAPMHLSLSLPVSSLVASVAATSVITEKTGLTRFLALSPDDILHDFCMAKRGHNYVHDMTVTTTNGTVVPCVCKKIPANQTTTAMKEMKSVFFNVTGPCCGLFPRLEDGERPSSMYLQVKDKDATLMNSIEAPRFKFNYTVWLAHDCPTNYFKPPVDRSNWPEFNPGKFLRLKLQPE